MMALLRHKTVTYTTINDGGMYTFDNLGPPCMRNRYRGRARIELSIAIVKLRNLEWPPDTYFLRADVTNCSCMLQQKMVRKSYHWMHSGACSSTGMMQSHGIRALWLSMQLQTNNQSSSMHACMHAVHVRISNSSCT